MAVDTSTLKANKPGKTREVNENGEHPAGLWRHPNGEEAVTLYDPLYGDAQSEAFARLGFVRVGDAPEGYVKSLATPSVQAEKDKAATTSNSDEVKGILARLNAVEDENARLKEAAQNKVDAFPGQEAAKKEAVDQTDARTSGGVTSDLATPEAPVEKPLDKQNTTELRATAEKEGVELTDEHDTKAKIAEAITAKREEGNK
jgi:hypothetical protein